MHWLWSAQILVPEASDKKWTDVSLTTPTWYSKARLHWGRTRWHADQNLKRCLANHFTGEGFDWHQTGWGKRRFRKLRAREPHLRVFWEPRGINWRFPFILCTAPSFHERLEARLELRDWLHDKVPVAEIEAWLSPNEPS